MRFNCTEQLSGIFTIDFYLMEETSNWPIQVSDRSAAQIRFTPEEHAVEGTIAPNSFKNDSKSKDDLYEIDLSYIILTRSEALEQLLDQYANSPGVALVKYYNGFTKLFGTKEEPLLLTFQVDDGTSIESKSGIEIFIEGIQRNRPVYYTI